jgi:hypothetical protein
MDTKNQNKSAIHIDFEKFGNNKATAKNMHNQNGRFSNVIFIHLPFPSATAVFYGCGGLKIEFDEIKCPIQSVLVDLIYIHLQRRRLVSVETMTHKASRAIFCLFLTLQLGLGNDEARSLLQGKHIRVLFVEVRFGKPKNVSNKIKRYCRVEARDQKNLKLTPVVRQHVGFP